MKDNDIEKYILNLLNSNSGITFSSREILRKLNLPRSDYRTLRYTLKGLSRQRRIEKVGKRTYRIKKLPYIVIGTISMTKYGYGFVTDNTNNIEIFIARGLTETAMDGDTVKIEVYSTRKGKSLEGEVIEVIKRAKKKIIGTYFEKKSIGYVIPDDEKLTKDLYIIKGKNKNAKPGEKIIAEFFQWESEFMNPEGIIKEVLGSPNKSETNITILERSFDLPKDFPAKLKKEIIGLNDSIPFSELKKRIDLRDKLIFTIDPEEAKDFDDAVSIEKYDNGNFLLSVHIADVSYYVKENTATDEEAFKRGTSVYLPEKCIPMLPKKLSENVCSLKPKKDRLTFSVFMKINEKGELINYRIAETVINSKNRLTYEKAQKILETKKDSKIGKTLSIMYDVAKMLKKNRIKNGSLDFDLPEIKFLFNSAGIIETITSEPRFETYDIIEEFMLLANKTVTDYVEKIAEKKKIKIPFIYRVHDRPDKKKIEDYANFLKLMGIKFSDTKRPSPKSFQKILEKSKGKPEEKLIGEITLRTMMKAEYSPKNIGHFGLAFRKYTHFTSPIRRYPDLIVHRILKSCKQEKEQEMAKRMILNLSDICKHSSEMEKRAEEVEREAIKIKQLEYISDKLGDEFYGIISGVKPYGIFVEIEGILVEGLVHIQSMIDDHYNFNENLFSLKGRYSGKTYKIGNKVKVQVVKVNLIEKQLDLILVK